LPSFVESLSFLGGRRNEFQFDLMEDDTELLFGGGGRSASTSHNPSVVPFLLPTDFLPFKGATTDRHYDRYLAHEKRWIFLGLVALPLWILFGNLLVLLSVIGFRHLRTLSNWVIASLAFTDFLLALTVVPFGIYQLVRAPSNISSIRQAYSLWYGMVWYGIRRFIQRDCHKCL